MQDKIFQEIEEDLFKEDLEDIYSDKAREMEVEDDELSAWEDAWMEGYEEAR